MTDAIFVPTPPPPAAPKSRSTAERYDFELRKYIETQRRLVIEANDCDFRPTSEDELVRAEAGIRDRFARTCVLLDAMTDADVARCRGFAALMSGTTAGLDDFGDFQIPDPNAERPGTRGGRATMRVVGPCWLSVYGDFVAARQLLTS